MIDAAVFSLRENQLRYRRRICHERLMRVGGGGPPCTFFSICPSIPAKVSRHWQHRRSRRTFAVNSGNFLVPRSPGMRSLDVHPNYPYWENIIMAEDRLGKTSTKYPLSCRPTSSRAQGRTLRQIIIGENLYIRPLLCIRTCAQPVLRRKKRKKKKNDEEIT